MPSGTTLSVIRDDRADFDAFLWSRSRRPRPRNFRVRFERSSLWIETAMVEAVVREEGGNGRGRVSEWPGYEPEKDG